MIRSVRRTICRGGDSG